MHLIDRKVISIAAVAKLPEPSSPDQIWNLAMQAMVRHDQSTASRLFQRVADFGEWQGHYMLAIIALPSTSPGDFGDALTHMDAAAHSGHQIALRGLAILLLNITGYAQRKRALVILQRLTADDDDLSKIILGLALEGEEKNAAAANAAIESLWSGAARHDWVWAMQLLAGRNFRRGRILAALNWKWLAFVTTFRLAKVDPRDIRLTNAS